MPSTRRRLSVKTPAAATIYQSQPTQLAADAAGLRLALLNRPPTCHLLPGITVFRVRRLRATPPIMLNLLSRLMRA